jgi:hypothetical protein
MKSVLELMRETLGCARRYQIKWGEEAEQFAEGGSEATKARYQDAFKAARRRGSARLCTRPFGHAGRCRGPRLSLAEMPPGWRPPWEEVRVETYWMVDGATS